jgi:catechol 2,3-dioxygenase-like lactoylglutathione lyase family enzyme
MKIALTGIYVNDPLAAFKFYTETLGFQEKLYMPEHLLAIVKSPEQPHGASLLLEPNDNPIAKDYSVKLYEAGLPVIIFGVDNLEQEYQRLIKLGVQFKNPPEKSDWGYDAFFDDGFGNWIQIHQELGN